MDREMLVKMIAQYKEQGNLNAAKYWQDGLDLMIKEGKEILLSF